MDVRTRSGRLHQIKIATAAPAISGWAARFCFSSMLHRETRIRSQPYVDERHYASCRASMHQRRCAQMHKRLVLCWIGVSIFLGIDDDRVLPTWQDSSSAGLAGA